MTRMILTLLSALLLACPGLPEPPAPADDDDARPPSDDDDDVALLDIPTLTEAHVWTVSEAPVGLPELEALASALGVTGQTQDFGASLQLFGSTVGPAGPNAAILSGARLELPVGAAALASACADGLDNDGDGAPDGVDADCEGDLDDDEATAGGQDAIARPALTMSLDSTGVGPLLGIDGALALTLPRSDGVVTLMVTLPDGGAVSIDPVTGTATATVAPTLTATCAGSGCWTGICTIAADSAALTTDDDGFYGATDGTGVLAGTLVLGAPSCETADPATVGAALGLPTSAPMTLDFTLETPIVEQGPLLVLDRAARTVSLTTLRTARTLGEGLLPTAEAAQETAEALLVAAGLRPPDPEVVITALLDPADVPWAWHVRFDGHLAAVPEDIGVLRAEAEQGHVDVTIGADGRLIALESGWRPVTGDPLVVPTRAWDAIAADLDGQVGAPLSDVPHVLDVIYGSGPARQPRRALDPIVVALDLDAGQVLAAARMTDYLPVPAADPSPSAPLDGSSGFVPLSVSLTAGTPPYSADWFSPVFGPLGGGLDVAVPLPDGRHTIGLMPFDANGPGVPLFFEVTVENSPVPADLGEERGGGQPILRNARIQTPEGPVVFVRRSRLGRASPLVSVENQGQAMMAMRMEQWRYQITFQIGDDEHFIRSDKCVDGVFPGSEGACRIPDLDGQFAETPGTVDLQVLPRGQIRSSFTANLLPGRVTMQYTWGAAMSYAGPNPVPSLTSVGMWALSVLSGDAWGARSKLGGIVPGFRPLLEWTYEPPAEGLTCDALSVFCTQYPGADREELPYCSISAADLADACEADPHNTAFDVVDFELWSYLQVHPMQLRNPDGNGEYTTLLRDGVTPFFVDASDGPLDDTRQPPGFYELGTDVLTEIEPLRNERTGSFVIESERGEWDNLHGKGGLGRDVSFPGCQSPIHPLTDTQPCLHWHTSWLESAPFPKGQTVLAHIVDSKQSEWGPASKPSTLVNGEAISWGVGDGGLGDAFIPDTAIDLIWWIESKASSTACAPRPGDEGVDNRFRPCQVFPTDFFFTH